MSDLCIKTTETPKTPPVANTSASPNFQRLVEHLHALGPRPVGEFLLELSAGDPDMELTIRANLERYARLDVEMVKGLGGDRFPALPLYDMKQGSKR